MAGYGGRKPHADNGKAAGGQGCAPAHSAQVGKGERAGAWPTQEPATRMDPLLDAVFLRTFGDEGSKGFVGSFVDAVLAEVGLGPIGEIEEIGADQAVFDGGVGCKAPRVDVCIVTAGHVVDLESQRYPEDVGARSALYASKLMSRAVKVGTDYKDIPQVVVITLLSDMVMFPASEDVVSLCRMRWESASGHYLEPGTDRIAFVLVELDKVRRRYNRLDEEVAADELTSWLYLLVQGYSDQREVDRMIENVKTIEEFARQYELAINDPKVVNAYEAYLSGEREYKSRQDFFKRMEREAVERGLERGLKQGIEQGIEQGLEQGRAIGIEQERDRITAALLASGMTQQEVDAIVG